MPVNPELRQRPGGLGEAERLQLMIDTDPEIQAFLARHQQQLAAAGVNERTRGRQYDALQQSGAQQLQAMLARKGIRTQDRSFVNPRTGQLEPARGWSGLSGLQKGLALGGVTAATLGTAGAFGAGPLSFLGGGGSAAAAGSTPVTLPFAGWAGTPAMAGPGSLGGLGTLGLSGTGTGISGGLGVASRLGGASGSGGFGPLAGQAGGALASSKANKALQALVAGLAGLPGLLSGKGKGGGYGSAESFGPTAEETALTAQLQSMLQSEEQRQAALERRRRYQDPLHQAVTQMAFGMLPSGYGGDAYPGTPPPQGT